MKREKWKALALNKLIFFQLGNFPGELSLEDIGNKCRDTNERPDGVPWCYTMDPKVRWEKCPVPECDFN